MTDSILCTDRDDAKKTGDDIGWEYIEDWIYHPDGKVTLITNIPVIDIMETFKQHITKRFEEVN